MKPDAFAELLADRRVAVVHEWIDAYAGSEQVFEAIARILPQADLYALSHEPGVALDVGGRPIRTTMLGRPQLRSHRALTLPLMPAAWRLLNAPTYDLVIFSHHAFAHTNRLAGPQGMHLCYVHSPARYIWSSTVDQRAANSLLAPARMALKHVDRRASRRVTAYAANSTAVAERIWRFWGREARVVHPPVRVSYFAQPHSAPPTRDYILGFGRWVPYKNLHLVVEAANRLRLPVKIAGKGPDKSHILESVARASVPVELIESPRDDQLRELYRNARCLVFPTIEDFGIIPIEAQAAGTPVVAPAAGGAIDTVRDGVTGALVRSLHPEDLADGVCAVARLAAADCRANAATFSSDTAARRLRAWVAETLASHLTHNRPTYQPL